MTEVLGAFPWTDFTLKMLHLVSAAEGRSARALTLGSAFWQACPGLPESHCRKIIWVGLWQEKNDGLSSACGSLGSIGGKAGRYSTRCCPTAKEAPPVGEDHLSGGSSVSHESSQTWCLWMVQAFHSFREFPKMRSYPNSKFKFWNIRKVAFHIMRW